MSQGIYKNKDKRTYTVQPSTVSQPATEEEHKKVEEQKARVENPIPAPPSEIFKKKRTNAREAIKIRNKKKKEQEQKKKNKYTMGKMGIAAGFITFAKGAGKACAGIAASPLLQFLGIGIAIASIGYMIWNFFS